MPEPALRCVYFGASDLPPIFLDDFVEASERVVSVERVLDGGYNTSTYKVWILTYAERDPVA